MKKLLHEPMVRFLAIGFVLYIVWFALYDWWIHPLKWVDIMVVEHTIKSGQVILNWMGYTTMMNGARMIGIQGTPGLFMGDSCNGISLFALFSIFIIAFPGKVFAKIIFIPAGIFIIHSLNILRVVALALIETYSYSWTQFNHTYTFTIMMYCFILLMWLLWINKFSGIKMNLNKKNG